MTAIRFHDHPHYSTPDLIAAGELRALELCGKVEYTDTFDLVRIMLDAPVTPVALAKRIEERLGIKHVRICGAPGCRMYKGFCYVWRAGRCSGGAAG